MTTKASAAEVGEAFQNRRCLGLHARILYYLGTLSWIFGTLSGTVHTEMFNCLAYKITEDYGVWCHDDTPETFIFYWRRYLPHIQMTRCCYSILFNGISVYIMWGTWDQVFLFTGNILVYIAIMFRFGSIYQQRQVIHRIFATFENLYNPDLLGTDALKKRAGRTEKLAAWFSKIIISSTIVFLLFSQLNVVIDGIEKRIIPFRLWLPYNYKSTPVLEATVITISVLFCLDFTMIVYPHLLFVSCCIHLIGQYKLLRYKLENILYHVEMKLTKTQELESTTGILFYEIESGVGYTAEAHQEREGEEHVGELIGIFAIGTMATQRSGSGLSKVHQNHNAKEVVEDNPSVFTDVTKEAQGRGERAMHRVSRLARVSPSRDAGDSPGPYSQHDRVVKPLQEEHPDKIDVAEGTYNTNAVTTEPNVRHRGTRWRKAWDNIVKSRDEQKAEENWTKVEMEKYLRHCAMHHQTILSLTRDLEQVFKVFLQYQTFINANIGLAGLYVTMLASKTDYKVIMVGIFMTLIYYEFFLFCWCGNTLTVESEKLREAIYGCEWYGASESFKRSIRIMISRTNKSEVIRGGGLPLSMKSFRFICRTGYYLHSIMVKIIHGVKINDRKI